MAVTRIRVGFRSIGNLVNRFFVFTKSVFVFSKSAPVFSKSAPRVGGLQFLVNPLGGEAKETPGESKRAQENTGGQEEHRRAQERPG